MPQADPHREDEEVLVLKADRAAGLRGRGPLIVGLVAVLLIGGAGVWIWLHPELLGRAAGALPPAPPPAAGNLLGDGWSFEATEAGTAFTFWSVPQDAPAGFDVGSSAAHSGALGAVAHPGDEGWCRVQSEKPAPLGAHRGAVELSAWSGTPDLALVLRFEAEGRPPVERVVAAGEGELKGAALVPPGATRVRAVLQATGEAEADDVELRFVDAAPGEQRLDRGAFQVLERGAHLLVYRGGELVLESTGLMLRDGQGRALPPAVARRPDSAQAEGGRDALLLPGDGHASSGVNCEQTPAAFTVREVLTGVPADATLVRTLLVAGPLAQAAIGLVSASGFSTFTGDFRVEGVRGLVLGHMQDRLVVELDEGPLVGTRQADGRWLLRAEWPAAGITDRTLVVRTGFQEERVAAAQHRDAALAAEKAGRLGEALAEAETVVTKYPQDEEVLAAASAVRGRLMGKLQERLDRIDRDLQDALFLASARRCREVLADCEDAARTWKGASAADRFRDRAATVAERAASLLEADRARRAGALSAVSESLRGGGYGQLADEIDDTLSRWLAAPPALQPGAQRPEGKP